MSDDLKVKLGRIHIPDDRDAGFPLAKALPKEAPGVDYKYWWAQGWWGDQGYKPHCVAFSWMHWLEDGPVTHFYENRDHDPAYLNENRHEKHQPLFDTTAIYNNCQKVDEWPGECVDEETFCLTKKGWKRYNQLKLNEQILTFDIKKQKTFWKPLQKIHVFENCKYKIWKNKAIEFACTDNHKWPVRSYNTKDEYKFVETKNWKGQHEFPRAAPYGESPIQTEWTDDFVELVAWVASEGSYRPEYRRGNGVIVSQKNYKNEVKLLMERIGAPRGGEKKDGTHVWEIGGHLAQQVRLVAPERAPTIEWLTQLSEKQLMNFIATFVKGDGNTTPAEGNRKSRRTISQKTGKILDSILAACVLVGQPVSRAAFGKGSGDNVETWTLRQSTHVQVRRLKNLEEKIGLVWCPQTENRTFIARRGKSIFITGNSYDGTSVRAGAKILKSLGVVSEYRWAYSIDDVVKCLLTTGPLVVGTWWHNDMFYPDENGLITPTGGKAGGHAYVLNGINLKKGLIRIKNSWGRSWGKNGYAYIKIEDFEKLLLDYGEACMAFEKRLEE